MCARVALRCHASPDRLHAIAHSPCLADGAPLLAKLRQTLAGKAVRGQPGRVGRHGLGERERLFEARTGGADVSKLLEAVSLHAQRFDANRLEPLVFGANRDDLNVAYFLRRAGFRQRSPARAADEREPSQSPRLRGHRLRGRVTMPW